MESSVLSSENKKEFKDFLKKVIDIGVDFKLQKETRKRHQSTQALTKTIVTELNDEGRTLDEVLDEFTETILPDSTNFSSPGFLGFPDSGNSSAALGGSVLSDFLQQNLINQSFCGPSATFVEIAVIRWLREAVGYSNDTISNVYDVGGIITPGGTSSNTIAMTLARENKVPGTMQKGVKDPSKYKIIVPKGIGHYSVKSAQRWVGCGNNLIEVDIENYRYNLHSLEKALRKNKGKVMALIAYVGDSRTMTIENLTAVATLTRSIDKNIWLHADACHGFSLGFSESLRHKISGIEHFDSISTDPHKTMLSPYTVSALLVKDPEKFKTIASVSELIMQEDFAFGQITPFIGSKSWSSLKLWFMMKNFGKKGLDELITKRHHFAKRFEELLKETDDFVVINEININSVAFMYVGTTTRDTEILNDVSKKIHDRLLLDGRYFLHQFSIPDNNGVLKQDALIYPLRFMCGNPNSTEEELIGLISYLREVGQSLLAN